MLKRRLLSGARTTYIVTAAALRTLLGGSPQDDWLERWLPLLYERARHDTILELGCGRGEDTALLCDTGFRVCAIDLSPRWLARARRRAPAAVFHCQDLRDGFPVTNTRAVFASLTLHYFAWEDTLRIIDRIQAVLAPDGVLLCRVNSTRDRYFGASGHEMIEPGYYRVHGHPKRFFDEAAILNAFVGWSILHIEERITYRYMLPKHVWEVVLQPPNRAIR